MDNRFWNNAVGELEVDGCCVSMSGNFDSGLGLDSGLSLPSIQSGNIASLHRDTTSEQLVVGLSRLQVSPDNQAHLHNVSLVQAAPITSPQSSAFFQQNEEGDTMLHITIIQNNVDLALQLIAMADDPEYLNIQNFHYYQSPLHFAVITDQPTIVRQLVVHGASPWKQDREGNTPIHLACKLGLFECLRQLTSSLSEEERKLVTTNMNRPPHFAQIVHHPADFCIKNYEGETCLHVAQCSPNKLNIIMFLILSLSVDINMQEGKCGYTLLHQAIKSHDLDIVKALLMQPSIDVNKSCYNGSTPLSLAKSNLQSEVVGYLISRGAADNTSEDSFSDSDDDQADGFDDLII